MSGLPSFTDPYLEISRGAVDGYSLVSLRGHDSALDSVARILVPFAAKFAVPSAAGAIQLSSDSADDDSPAGTGALTVLVEGLDADYLPVSETFTLNGTAAVTGAIEFLRINSMTVLTAGTGTVNAGNIFASPSGQALTSGEPDDNVYATIEIGEGVAAMGIYTVPADKTAYLVRGDGQDVDAADPVNMMIFQKSATGARKADNRTYIPAGSTVPLLLSGKTIPEKTDIRIEAYAANPIEAFAILTLVVVG